MRKESFQGYMVVAGALLIQMWLGAIPSRRFIQGFANMHSLY